MSSYQTFTLAGDPATLGRLQAEQVRSRPHLIRAPRPSWADVVTTLNQTVGGASLHVGPDSRQYNTVAIVVQA